MFKITQIALRNLARYKRRSILTGLLIALGVASVIVYGGVSGSFKGLMIGQITDSMLGHIQIHRTGYVSSIENLPLDRNILPKAYDRLVTALETIPDIQAFSPRLKLGAMLSNYENTTNIRLNGIDPEKEAAVVPNLAARIRNGSGTGSLLKQGEILVPEILANGLQIKPGDTVVLVANNNDGSVNGITVKVSGVVENVTGPGGRDGYIHMKDAAELLRMTQPEISEVAVRLKDFGRLEKMAAALKNAFQGLTNQKGQPLFEVHTWDQLSPFSNIANLIDMMSLFIQTILVAVVLVSILNIMIMSVYERIREIGTITAIGTTPAKVLALFLVEGLALGTISALAGTVLGGAIIGIVHFTGVNVTFGRGQVYSLFPTLDPRQILISALVVIVISALASLWPAAKAARLEPVDALRHV